MHDVAAVAGTSVKTVSRVVNREGGVSPELVTRVTEAVQRLGYRPDNRARQLRRGSVVTGTIGLVQNDVANPFFASIFKGVEEVAAAAGYVVLAANSEANPDRQVEIVHTFIERRVDGLIVVPASDDVTALAVETRLGTPVVFIDMMPAELIGDVVVSDHAGGAFKATMHLIEHGHTRVAFLGDDQMFFSARERHRGYAEALEAAGLELDPAIARFDMKSPQLAEAAAREMLALPNPPTAIFSSQNLISIGTVRALRGLGLSYEVAVVGFDDIEFADMLEPALSVAPQNPHGLGRRGAELLFERLGGRADPPVVEVDPIELIERGSGEIRPPAHS